MMRIDVHKGNPLTNCRVDLCVTLGVFIRH